MNPSTPAGNTADSHPNILLIHVDDLNDWVLRPEGHPQPIMPNLDRLMSRGVSFGNCHAAVPVCGPSRKCFYSGWYPQTMNDWQFGDWDKMPALKKAVPMPLHFRNHGYFVYGSGKLIHEGRAGDFWSDYGIGPDYGPWPWKGTGSSEWTAHPDQVAAWAPYLMEGIHRDLNYGPMSQIPVWPADPDGKWPGATGWYYADGTPLRYESETDRDPLPDEIVTNSIVEILRKKHDRPFFAGAGMIRPHSPLYAPKECFDRFPIERITLPPYLENDLDDCVPVLCKRWPLGLMKFKCLVQAGGVQAWKEWVQAYLACIAFLDDQVGRMLDALESGPNRNNTIIVFTSDNGYHVGEKDCIQKWHLWEESTRVPLIIYAPGLTNGGTCDQPVSHVDVYATLVDLCGLPKDPHGPLGGAPLDGHSLRPLLSNPEHGEWDGPPVAITSIDDRNVPNGLGPHYSVRSKRYRYTLCSDGGEEFYDHENDLHEWHNRADDAAMAAAKQEMRREMIKLVPPATGRPQE